MGNNPGFTVLCHVCNRKIGFMGWPNHVSMEKRKYGNDIYIVLKKRRDAIRRNEGEMEEILTNPGKNKRISDYD